MADFPPVIPEFHQRTQRVRLKNLGTTDKKSSRKIKYKKIPRVHNDRKEDKKMQNFEGKFKIPGNLKKCSLFKTIPPALRAASFAQERHRF